MRRRDFLGGFLLAPAGILSADAVWADESAIRFSVTGPMTQASLAMGRAPPGSLAALNGRPLRTTPRGRFVFGFAWDQTEPALVTVRYPDGTGDSRRYTPAPRQYPEQRVNGLPQATVTPPPGVAARIEREAAAIYLARLTDNAGQDFLAGLDWPVPGIVSGPFGSRRIDNGTPMPPHFGVDIAAPAGTPIRAPADGTVAIGGDYYLDGGFTLIDHGQGVSTAYLHQSRRLVGAGDRVRRGQTIGRVGQSGRATGPHLHWAMTWFEVKLDPSLSTRKPKPDSL